MIDKKNVVRIVHQRVGVFTAGEHTARYEKHTHAHIERGFYVFEVKKKLYCIHARCLFLKYDGIQKSLNEIKCRDTRRVCLHLVIFST